MMAHSIPKIPQDILDRLRTRLEYDFDTGWVTWGPYFTPARCREGDRAGTLRKDGYRYIKMGNYVMPIGRVAWYLVHGSWPEGHVRYIDGDPENTRMENMYDSAQDHSALPHYVKTSMEERKQARSDALWLANLKKLSEIDAHNGLMWLGPQWALKRESDIRNAVYELKDHSRQGFQASTDANKTEDEWLAEGTAIAYGTEANRGTVDEYLRLIGVEPPEDVEAAFRLVLALS